MSHSEAENPPAENPSLDTKIERAFHKLYHGGDFLSFELTPLVGGQILKAESLEALRACRLFDCYVCTDSPLARFKPSSVLSSIRLQNELHTPLICTLSMRDRNSLALCGEVLAANGFNLRAFLSLSGDPIRLGNTQAQGVFEGNSTKLNAIITRLNCGFDLSGRALNQPLKPIYNCNVINSYTNNPKSLETKMIRKITSSLQQDPKPTQPSSSPLLDSPPASHPSLESKPKREAPLESSQSLESHLDSKQDSRAHANPQVSSPTSSPTSSPHEVGLRALFSQPVYDVDSALLLLESLASANAKLGTSVPLVLGFFPVVSYKSALFLRDKLPGVFIPKSWIQALEQAHHTSDPKANERAVGLELSRELFTKLRSLHKKFHLMANGNLPLAQELLL